MPSGYIMRDKDHEDKDEEKKKNGNGHHSNGNGDGSGESNGGSDGGGDGGGGVAEGWSAKYKKSIDCNNPKGFSQRAHCRGRKKMNEAKNGDHEVAMAQSQLAKAERNIAKLRKALGKKEKDIPAWMQAKITDTAHDTDAAAGYADKISEQSNVIVGTPKPGGAERWAKMSPDQKVEYAANRAANQAKGVAAKLNAAKKEAQNVKVQDTGSVRTRVIPEEVISEKRDGKSAKDKGYSLRDWFKGGGWVQAGGKYDGKPCAKQPGQKTKPFCRDADDRASMSKDERERRAKKKRREDPNPNREGKAKMVTKESYSNWRADFSEGYDDGDVIRPTDRIKMLDGKVKTLKDIDKKIENKKKPLQKEEVVNEKKDACYHKVKSRYSVWPSAYASGALVKCRKVGAKNWGNKTKKEGYDYSNWRDDFKAMEFEVTDLIKPEPMKGLSEEKSTKDRLKEVSKQLAGASKMHAKQSKEVAKCADELDEAKKCWKGYKKAGTQKLFGKTYNRCVKKEEVESVSEEKLGKCEKNKIEKYVKGMKKNKSSFKDSYGDDAKPVMYATATNMAKKACKEGFSDWRSELDLQEKKMKNCGCGQNPCKTYGKQEVKEDWQKVNRGDKTDGMSQKAVNAYKRENPGSKLQTAVTEKNPSGKRAKRRKSFCARSNGQRKMHNIDCSKTPDKKICKARKRWNC